jgi:predicted amidohydrolase
MRVAVVNWEVHPITEASEFFAHLNGLLTACRGADLIVLPELPVLELLALHDVPESQVVEVLAPYAAPFLEALIFQARARSCTIVGGGYLDEKRRNVCPVVDGSGEVTLHPKNVLTQWEKVDWGLSEFDGLPECLDKRLGVTICYDCEFPEGGRVLAERGVLLQIIPAYTETQFGFQRVRWSAQARALENQIFVAHASLVGSLGREPVSRTHGRSAILTPSVPPFPVSATLAETSLNAEGIAFAELDFDALLRSREEGDVRNWNDRAASSWGQKT